MEQVRLLMQYVMDHQSIGLAVVVGAGVLYWLLNRKPRYVREADEQIERLRKDRGSYYDQLRPPH